MICIISIAIGWVYVYTIYVKIIAIELTFLFFSFECGRVSEIYSHATCTLNPDATALTPLTSMIIISIIIMVVIISTRIRLATFRVNSSPLKPRKELEHVLILNHGIGYNAIILTFRTQ